MMEWSGVFESLAFSGIAFLVAASSPIPAPRRHRESAGPQESTSGPITNLEGSQPPIHS
jgi:hypothetical protein